MRPFPRVGVLLGVWALAAPLTVAQASNLAGPLKALREVDREGKGHRAASQAWNEIAKNGQVSDLPQILAAMDGVGPLGANWLHAAVDAIAERNLKAGKLPLDGLEKFLQEKQHDPRARRLAYEWIAKADTGAPDRLIPGMIDDPSLELRRDAVSRVLKAAETAQANKATDEALATYRKALVAARDLDQVRAAAEALGKLGQPVDLAHHFGFLQDWQLVGPFDNKQGKGFEAVYPPESALDLTASYPTESGPVRWIAHHTDDANGQVDLNAAIGKHMGVVAYALAEFQSDKAQPVELRLGTEAANKIWLNGKLLSSADVYHANGTMDQYVGRGELKKGRNVILLKICQNEQKEDWAQDWKFQLRACDSSGKAILSTDRPAPRPMAQQTAAIFSKE